MARPRLQRYKALPPNLYWEVTRQMFRYRRPDNGTKHYVGKNREKAVAAAKKLNSLLMDGEDIVLKVMDEGKTLAQYIDERFIAVVLPERKLSEKTWKEYRRMLNIIKNQIGHYSIAEIVVKNIADFLNKQNGARQINKLRGLLSLIFKYARADGLIESNPAESTLKRQVTRQRHRLKLTEFYTIRKLAGEENCIWLQNAMDIALVTLQRRKDVVHLKFSDIEYEEINGKMCKILKVIQEKRKNMDKVHILKLSLIND